MSNEYIGYIGEHASKCRELVAEVTILEGETRKLKQKELEASMLITLHLIQALDSGVYCHLKQNLAMFKQIDSTVNEIISLELEAATDLFISALHSLSRVINAICYKVPFMTDVFQRYVVCICHAPVCANLTLWLETYLMCVPAQIQRPASRKLPRLGGRTRTC